MSRDKRSRENGGEEGKGRLDSDGSLGAALFLHQGVLEALELWPPDP